METVLITDTHFNGENIMQVNDIFKQCFKLARLSKTKTVFHLGDWFTNRTGQTLQTLIAVLNVLNQAQSLGITIHTIPGNHDKTDLEEERSYLEVFRTHPSLRLYSEHGAVEIGSDLNLMMLPYFPEDGSYKERLSTAIKMHLKNKKKNVLLTHTTLNGALNNDGTKQENSITKNLFSEFHWVLSGHYHNRNSPWNRAQYIGSPRAANFGEDNEKGFTTINSEGGIKFVKSNFQQFHQFHFDLNNIDSDLFESDYNEAVELGSNGHRVRAVVTGTVEMLEVFDFQLFKSHGIEVLKIDQNVSKSVRDLEENLSASFSPSELKKAFIEYCKLNGIQGELLSIGVKLIKDI